ncbi:MAG: penicillin acylase family protein, partial [Candidatus Acidiferrum sp.]
MRTIFRWLAWLLTLMLLIACGGLWWLVYRPLPQIDGTVKVAGLQKEVTVERDGWGVPHIRASSVPDMVEAEGYVMAQDRLWQMDLLRRAAKGQLSEILGPSTLKIDENFRTLGFDRAAERDAAQLDGETRELMEAYARGVNRFIEQHLKSLPLEFSLLKYRPRPWLPSDTLAISGYMYLTLTDTWEEELARAKVTERVGADRAKDLFAEDAAMDHFVLGDPGVPNDGSKGAHAKKGNEDDDDDDDDDMKPDTVLKAEAATIGRSSAPSAFVDLTSAFAELPPSRSQSPAKSADELLPAVRDFFRESGSEIRHGLGSNNWVVSGAHTASGKPLLANDTH